MTNKAAALVAGAKQWASYYGDYPNGEEGAVLTAILRIRAAWSDNDADAYADMYVDEGSLLVGDNQLTSRDQIRAYMSEAFAAGYKGTQVTTEPREIRLLTDGVALAITDGGVIREGLETLAPEDEVRGLWIVVKRDGDWRIAAHQTSPVKS